MDEAGFKAGHLGFVSSMLSPRSSGTAGISSGLATSLVACSIGDAGAASPPVGFPSGFDPSGGVAA
jgi:hypothetical protein